VVHRQPNFAAIDAACLSLSVGIYFHIGQVPAGKFDEHIFQARVPSGQIREPAIQVGQAAHQGRQRKMRLRHR
jgi:hypothetical protein